MFKHMVTINMFKNFLQISLAILIKPCPNLNISNPHKLKECYDLNCFRLYKGKKTNIIMHYS